LKKKLKRNLVVAVDLDGVIAEYDGWKGINVIDVPKKGAVEYLTKLSEEGWIIIVFTSRNIEVGNYVEKYLRQWKIPFDAINKNINDWHADCLKSKIYANLYLDDKSLNSVGKKWVWRKIYRKIRRKYKRFYERVEG